MSGRFDFVTEVIRADDATHTAYLTVAPHPKRYSEIEIDGRPHYLDKFLRLAIPADEMRKMAIEQLQGLPVYSNPPTIDSAPAYAETRKAALDAELQGRGYSMPSEKAAPQRSFETTATSPCLTFLSVDICGSTGQRRVDAKSFERAYEIFLRELGTAVGQFHGSILKTTGDGFITYVDYPAFTTQCDNTIDLGLTFLVLLRDSINPALKAASLPELKIRVGADYGEAQVRNISVPATGFSTNEIASDALNRSVKIQESAGENEFRIGRGLYELIHVQWLERCTNVPFVGTSVGLPNYQIYQVR